MTGRSRRRISAFVSRELSWGIRENTTMLIPITNSRKLVPQRGWRFECALTVSGKRSAFCS